MHYLVKDFIFVADGMQIFSYRFSPDAETSIGLVQHEGGPCGVLAAIQVIS